MNKAGMINDICHKLTGTYLGSMHTMKHEELEILHKKVIMLCSILDEINDLLNSEERKG